MVATPLAKTPKVTSPSTWLSLYPGGQGGCPGMKVTSKRAVSDLVDDFLTHFLPVVVEGLIDGNHQMSESQTETIAQRGRSHPEQLRRRRVLLADVLQNLTNSVPDCYLETTCFSNRTKCARITCFPLRRRFLPVAPSTRESDPFPRRR